jgi:hypothetical protein
MKTIHQYVGSLPNTINNQQGNYAAAFYQYLEQGSNQRYYPDYTLYYISADTANRIEAKCREIYNKEH